MGKSLIVYPDVTLAVKMNLKPKFGIFFGVYKVLTLSSEQGMKGFPVSWGKIITIII